jgi:hypothetical protein
VKGSARSDTLGLHQVIKAAVDPLSVRQVGLKVDVDALPLDLRRLMIACPWKRS